MFSFSSFHAFAVDASPVDSSDEITLNPVILCGLANNMEADQPQWFKDLNAANNYSESACYVKPRYVDFIPAKVTKAQAAEITTLFSDDLVPIMYTADELEAMLKQGDGEEYKYLVNLKSLKHLCKYAFSKEQLAVVGPYFYDPLLLQLEKGYLPQMNRDEIINMNNKREGEAFDSPIPCRVLQGMVRQQIKESYDKQLKFVEEQWNAVFTPEGPRIQADKLAEFRAMEDKARQDAEAEVNAASTSPYLGCDVIRKNIIEDKYTTGMWEPIQLKELQHIIKAADDAKKDAQLKAIDAFVPSTLGDKPAYNDEDNAALVNDNGERFFKGVDREALKAVITEKTNALNTKADTLNTVADAQAAIKKAEWNTLPQILADRYKSAPNCYSGSIDDPGCKVKFISKDSITDQDFIDGAKKYGDITSADGETTTENYPEGTDYKLMEKLAADENGIMHADVATKFADLSWFVRRIDVAPVAPLTFKKGEELSKDAIINQVRALAEQNKAFPADATFEVVKLDENGGSQRAEVKITYPQPNTYTKQTEETVSVPLTVISPVIVGAEDAITDETIINAIDKSAFKDGTTYAVTKQPTDDNKFAEVTITYPNGLADVVKVPVAKVEKLVVNKNATDVTAETVASVVDKTSFPEGTTYELVAPVDTTTEGDGTTQLKVVYPNGATELVVVPFNVAPYSLGSEPAPVTSVLEPGFPFPPSVGEALVFEPLFGYPPVSKVEKETATALASTGFSAGNIALTAAAFTIMGGCVLLLSRRRLDAASK